MTYNLAILNSDGASRTLYSGQQVEDNQCDNKTEKTCNEKLEEQSKWIGEVVQLSSKWTILKNDW